MKNKKIFGVKKSSISYGFLFFLLITSIGVWLDFFFSSFLIGTIAFAILGILIMYFIITGAYPTPEEEK